MPELRFSSLALTDLRDIRRYIAENDSVVAKRFVGELVARCENLAAMPYTGRERPELGDGLRSIPFGHYLILYRIADDNVEVLRVIHGARDTGRLFR